MASSVAGQLSWLTTTVVTASGGADHDLPPAMAAWIWKNLMSPTPTTMTVTAASMMIIRFFIPAVLLGDSFALGRARDRTKHGWRGRAVRERAKALNCPPSYTMDAPTVLLGAGKTF